MYAITSRQLNVMSLEVYYQELSYCVKILQPMRKSNVSNHSVDNNFFGNFVVPVVPLLLSS